MSVRPILTDRVFEIVREAMPDQSRLGTIGLDDDLRDAGLNSMAMVKLMMAAEAAFNIAIPDADLNPNNFRSVRAVEALVARLAPA